ncbi:MAG: hypothetical protein VCF25_04385 [Candidatus Poribacteria bacterium]
MTENGLRTELAKNPIQVVDGEVPVPDAPGLGLRSTERCWNSMRCRWDHAGS